MAVHSGITGVWVRGARERISGDYPSSLEALLGESGARTAGKILTSLPDYQSTPLYSLPGHAQRLGIADLYYKDEALRFGVGSFKAVGGIYAVYRTLLDAGVRVDWKASGELRVQAPPDGKMPVICCASAGNHGAGVSLACHLFGCQCVVFVPRSVTECRCKTIEHHGARVIQTRFGYDETVVHAQAVAECKGWHVVADTAYEGYTRVPGHIMHAYTIIARECLEQLGGNRPPTHVFLQTGVGSFAAAMCAQFWMSLGARRPLFVLVEAHSAASALASLCLGYRTGSGLGSESIMLGLASDELSLSAWDILRKAADAVLAITDDAALGAMRALAGRPGGDRGIAVGEAGSAGYAALQALSENEALRTRLDLNSGSRALVFGTEGPVDTDSYRSIVGSS